MSTKIFSSSYKDQKVVTIESEKLRVQFLPDIGAKMASVIYKPTGREILTQRAGEKYKLQPYDGNYCSGEGSGFDDMFPTIDEMHYHKDPWKGTKLPDHGEVWPLKWHFEKTDQSLYFKIAGIRLPYQLEKRIRFTTENTIRIDYKATNLSDFDMDYLWAAHLMLETEEGAQIFIPKDLKTAALTFCKSRFVGSYGTTVNWPEMKTKGGETFNASSIRARSTNDVLKYYFLEKLSEGWGIMKLPSDNTLVGISFPAEKVPYLALLHNEGGSHDIWGMDYYNFYFEPCTAAFDRPDIAGLHSMNSVLKANSTEEWFLNIVVDQKNNFTKVNQEGNII
jgi:hypothetical protein